VQLCFDDEDDEDETPDSIRDTCMQDLKDSAHVLEAAVSSVAAAAKRPAQQQPSEQLVGACFSAVCDLLGAFVLRTL
jgi:hypothetical protein